MNITFLYADKPSLSARKMMGDQLDLEEIILPLMQSGYQVSYFDMHWHAGAESGRLCCNQNTTNLAGLTDLDPTILVIVKSELPSNAWLAVAKKAKRLYTATTIIYAGVKQEGEAFGMLNGGPWVDYVALNKWQPVRAIIDYVSGESAQRDFTDVVRRTKNGLTRG